MMRALWWISTVELAVTGGMWAVRELTWDVALLVAALLGVVWIEASEQIREEKQRQ